MLKGNVILFRSIRDDVFNCPQLFYSSDSNWDDLYLSSSTLMMIEKRQTVYNLTTNLLCFFELQFIWDIGLSHRTLPSPLRRAAPMPFNPTARFIVLYISTLVLL